ncbi:hypothetical protein M413DRAFT_443747 [Hebeloma cylindrosporum]|uniref:Uncharacterized protein n=1 Tax=Hebeloma cylindrosporum TaxID=76867 RepID=A0A0C3CIA3_HEBCY|nr:hypothetical protein M413DRAFT_443747 [Hebeloma cylindrosporum h7]
MAPSRTQLAALWPNPGPSLTADTPARWPGSTPASTAAARSYLQQDYERHHGFFNYRGFHNHTPFHILVEWALGGNEEHLEAIWNQHLAIERLAHRSPAPITEQTFNKYLGDEEYYQGYLYFFSDLVLKKPIHDVVEEWIFLPKANFGGYNGHQPEMLNRLLAGVLHPMLFLGYGLEFSLPGLVAEGLTQAAVHKVGSSALLPKSMFDTPGTRRPGTHVHAFSVLSRIIRDRRFNNFVGSFDDVQSKHGDAIQQYAAEWTVDGTNIKEVASKVRELTFLNVMLYVVGGWRDGEGFHIADFTLMHLVTSSMTLTSYMAVLTSPMAKSLLLRAYFTRSLAYYISRGRPPLPVRSFFSAPILTDFPDPRPYPSDAVYPKPTSPLAFTPNVWLKIIQSALVHPDDHLPKVQRTLAHYGTLYGNIPAGEFKGTELEGSEFIDGTLFVRTAALTMEWMGRIREGEPLRFWGDDPNFPESDIP